MEGTCSGLDKKRPFRIIIDTLHEMTPERVAQVSERSMTLKLFIKALMVMLIWIASLVSGTSIFLLKVIEEVLVDGGWHDNWNVVLLIIAVVVFTADTQLQFLNVAMKLYDQLEVIPIYQTFVMFSWIGIGLFLQDEYVYYSWEQILAIFGCALLCLFGVKILTAKHKTEEQLQVLKRDSSNQK